MNPQTNPAYKMSNFVIIGLVVFTLTLTNVHALGNKTTGPVRIVTILEPPFVMKDPHTGKFTGLMIDVLEAAGIPIDHIETPIEDKYGWEEDPGEFSGVVGDLVNGKYDLAVAPFTIRSKRAKVVTFTQPVIHSGYMVLYKMPDDTEWKFTTDTIKTLLKPFSPGLWCLIIFTSIVVSVALHLIRRFSPYEYDVTSGQTGDRGDKSLATKSWGSGLMYLLGALTGRNASVTPNSTSGRILTAVWWAFSLMTVAAYVAGLVVILFKFNPHVDTLPFTSVEEMVAGTKVKVLGVKNSATFNYMKGHEGHYERQVYNYWKHNWDQLMVETIEEALKMMDEGNGKYAVFMDEALADYLASQEPCNKMVVGDPVGDKTVGFACPKGTQVCDDMNHVILNLQETGQMEKLREKWFWSGCHMSSEIHLSEKTYFDTFGSKEPNLLSPHSITIHRFAAAFIILAIGFVLALAVLVVEVFYFRKKGNIHHRLKNLARHDDAQGIQDQDFVSNREP